MRSIAILVAAGLAASGAFADVTGAYADPDNNASASGYMIVTQRGNSVLATYNLIQFPQPGLFGSTNYTNVFMYGIGAFDPATQTARIAFSGITRTACTSVYDLHFTPNTFVFSQVSTTCTGSAPAPKQFNLVF